jgi:hypothetical protein
VHPIRTLECHGRYRLPDRLAKIGRLLLADNTEPL